jgi:hypothetical protein
MHVFLNYLQTAIYFVIAYYHWSRGLFLNLNHKLLEYSGLNPEIPAITIEEVPPKPNMFENKYLEELSTLATQELTTEKIESLCNNFIMENTPVGNIIMQYDHNKSAFLYYSDNVVPFRFLEPVGRKYVITFQCKQLFIDMKEEIERATKEEEAKQNTQQPKPVAKKTKDILASFNSKTNDSQSQNSSNTNTINPNIKINTNRYTCMGKISNFQMIKKVDKKLVDKNYSMSFSDFKQMMKTNKT